MSIIELRDVHRTYGEGHAAVRALRGVNLVVPPGQFVAIMGPSGSGKSTLLHMVGALDWPSSGDVILDGQPIAKLDDDALTRLRRDRIGFIFQFFNLLPTLTAIENVCLPALLAGKTLGDVSPKAKELLTRVGLGGRLNNKPSQMSGGEQQRVAIARALITDPPILLADEPTGNLDSKSGAEVLQLLREACDERRVAIVMVTHDANAALKADRQVNIKDGEVVSDVLHKSGQPAQVQ
ncbi:MAG: ABC transporter ATP-binding protein [Myxococcota bacterium]